MVSKEERGMTKGRRGMLHVHVGGADSEALRSGRHCAELELIDGLERAISCLHPDDVAGLAWYRERLADARLLAGLPLLELARTGQQQQLASPG
jgi:hypothetical protein